MTTLSSPALRRRRSLATCGAALAASLTLAGCSASGDEASPEDPDSFAGSDVTVWSSVAFDPFMSMNEEYFQQCAEELDVSVTVEVFADNYAQQVLQAAGASSLPDIALLSSSEVAQFGSEGILEDLADFGIDDTSGSEDVIAELGQYEGVQYGSPSHAETYALMWNPVLFEEAGIEDAPETFDEVMEAARALDEAGYIGITLPGDPNMSNTALYFLSFYVGTGGDPADLEESIVQDASIEALTFYKELYDEGLLPADFVNWGWDAPEDWRAADAGMTVSGIWEFYNNLSFDYDFGVSPTPVVGDNAPGGAILGYSWGLPLTGDATTQAAAAALIECRNTEEHQAETAEATGYIPAITAAQDAYLEVVPDAAPFIDAMPGSFSTGAMQETWFDIALKLSNAIQYATADGDDPEAALERAERD